MSKADVSLAHDIYTATPMQEQSVGRLAYLDAQRNDG